MAQKLVKKTIFPPIPKDVSDEMRVYLDTVNRTISDIYNEINEKISKSFDDTDTTLHASNPFPVGLAVTRPSVSTISITFTDMYVQGLWATAGTYVVDIATVGALGRDASTAENADEWYYGYVIVGDDGRTSALISLSETTPTLPSGYSKYRLCTMVRNTAGNFVAFNQQNNYYGYIGSPAIYSSTSTAEYTADVNISQWLPKNAYKFYGTARSYGTKSGSAFLAALYIRGYVNDVMGHYILNLINCSALGGSAYHSTAFSLNTFNRTIYVDETQTSDSPTTRGRDIWMAGFEIWM